MTINPCLEAGCTSAGVFPGARDAEAGPVEGFWCFGHDPGALTFDPATAVAPVVDVEADRFHLDVVAGFAAMVLEHAAMTAMESDTANDDAMRSLASNSALALDLAAGILLALTAIMSAGGVTPEQVTDLAAIYESQANAEDPDDDDDDDDESQMSRLADDLGYVSDFDDPEVGPDDERDAMASEVPCERCDGTGWHESPHEGKGDVQCAICDGRGLVDIAGPEQSLVVADDEEEVSPATVVEDEATQETSNDG